MMEIAIHVVEVQSFTELQFVMHTKLEYPHPCIPAGTVDEVIILLALLQNL